MNRSDRSTWAQLAYIRLQPPGWMAAPRTHEDGKEMWFCFTAASLPDELTTTETPRASAAAALSVRTVRLKINTR